MENLPSILLQSESLGAYGPFALLILALSQLLKHLPPVIDSIRRPWNPIEREDDK